MALEHHPAGSTPVPDPTVLTTEQLLRAMADMKEMFSVQLKNHNDAVERLAASVLLIPSQIERDVNHLKGFVEARLDGMDKAILLMQSITDRVPQLTDEKINSLKMLHEEKFNSIQTQFRERDVRTEQSSKDSKVAVDAALQAAKEAVGEQNKSSALAISKSEAATTKQIDQIGASMQAQTKNVDDKFTDMKDRLTMIEGRGALIEGRGTGRQDSWGWAIGAIGIVVALIAIVGAIVEVARAVH
jgi:hypothetical protein